MNAIINILKPSGMSSNKVLNVIKRRFQGEKIGHFGTLDPMATGVLPVGIGKANRLFDYFLNKRKEYIALFEFGITTDTFDAEGKIIQKNNVDLDISIQDIETILPKFIGNIQQIPPMYSAINVNGQRAYQLARKGIEIELKSKNVYIEDIKVLCKVRKNQFLFKINCSSGTYVRSIIRDLANELNTIGYMPQLIRTVSGPFSIENSFTIEEIENNQFEVENIDKILSLGKFSLPNKYYKQLNNGVKIKLDIENKEDFLLYCNNELFGIAIIENYILKLKINLKEK